MKLSNMILRDPDDTEPSGSSPEGSQPAVPGKDAQTGSSPEPDLTKGLQAAIKAGLDKAQATAQGKPATPEPPKADDSDEETQPEEAPEGSEPQEEESEPEAKSETPEEKPEPDQGKGPIPYERFQEVVKARQELETQVAQQSEIVKAQQSINDYCQENDITPDDFSYWLEIAALSKRNPEEALKRLSPQLETWRGFTGEALSPELQKAVEAGDLSLDYAKRLQAAENQKQHVAKQAARTAEQEKARREREFVNGMMTSFGNWLSSRQKAVPDFAPKKNGSPDGAYEYFLYKLNMEAPKAGIKDSQSLIEFAERIYKEARTAFGKPASTANGKSLRTNSSAATAPRTQPKSLEDAIRLGAQGAGLRIR